VLGQTWISFASLNRINPRVTSCFFGHRARFFGLPNAARMLNANSSAWNPYSQPQPVQRQSGPYEVGIAYEVGSRSISSITSVRLDPFEELLWTGTSSGRVVSYQLPTNEKYTSWQGHSAPMISHEFAPSSAVQDILLNDQGIVSLAPNGLRFSTRGGLLLSNYMHNDHQSELYAMCFSDERSGSTRSKLFFGGSGDSIYLFNLQSNSVIQEIQIPHGVSKIKRGRSLYCGTGDGKLIFCDARSNRIENTYHCFPGGISDIAERGDFLVVSGYSERVDREGNPLIDPMVKVFDIRYMRPLKNIPFHASPYYLNFHPKFSSMLTVCSAAGHFQYLDLNTGMPHMAPWEIATSGHGVSCFDISTTGSVIAFGSYSGVVHEWSEREDFVCNGYSNPSVPLPPPYVPPSCEMNEWSPLSTPAMDLVLEECTDLLSGWNGCLFFALPHPAHPLLSPDMERNLRKQDFLGVIPTTPGSFIRNLVRSTDPMDLPNNLEYAFSNGAKLAKQPQEAAASQLNTLPRPTKLYRKVAMHHNAKGFLVDMSGYNQTQLTGLDNTLANSYINPLLQVIYWIPSIHAHCKSHLHKEELSLTSELGFLFHMLDLSHGGNSEPRNFLKTLSDVPSAIQAGILEEEGITPTYERLIEKVQSTLFDQLHKEHTTFTPINYRDPTKTHPKPAISIINEQFGSSQCTTNHCHQCENETSITLEHTHYNLVFPEIPSSFATVLKNSLCPTNTTHAWCQNCNSFQLSDQRKDILSLPDTLILNCYSPNHHQQSEAFWTLVGENDDPKERKPDWIPFKIEMTVDNITNKLQIKELSDRADAMIDDDCYVLTAVVNKISDWRAASKTHLVANIRVKPSCHPKEVVDPRDEVWFLFNDFCVSPISKFQAIQINPHWKIPCMLYYTRMSTLTTPRKSIDPLGDHIFFVKDPLERPPGLEAEPASFTPLSASEVKALPGALVAIDSEHVRISTEEVVQRVGRNVVVKPVQSTLARVSVLRTWDTQYLPFIDDYISTPETKIKDYLTVYSGLHPGDLDPLRSVHHVTTRKHCYLKLRRLVDCGCKFVGHGLQKDFAIINMVVPPDQIVDTVNLFYIEGARRISLRFLALLFLGIEIQKDTHDSIEDAKTALLLYFKYLEIKKSIEGKEEVFQDIMNTVYDLGEAITWKPELYGGNHRQIMDNKLLSVMTKQNDSNSKK